MKRPKVITFDAGYTLVYPCFNQFNQLAHQYFGQTFTPEQLKKAERRVRDGKTPHSLEGLPAPGLAIYFSGGMISELIPSCMDNTQLLVNFLRECATVQDSWFHILGVDVISCLEVLGANGFALGIISNANGKVINNLCTIEKHMKHIVDSGVVGFEKPDPRIFQLTHELFGVRPDEMLHVGDSVSADVHGALAAGSHAALYDPDCLVNGTIPPWVPRFRSLMDFANSFCPCP